MDCAWDCIKCFAYARLLQFSGGRIIFHRMEKTPADGGGNSVSLADLQRLGNMLARLSTQLTEASEELKALGCTHLAIAGLKSAMRGEGYVRTFMKSVREAVDDEAVKPDVPGKKIARKAVKRARDASVKNH